MKIIITYVLVSAVAIACGGEVRQRDPELTSARESESRAPGWPDLGRGTARFIRIDLGPDTYAECRRVSPKFPFDSASTYAQDRAQLVALASCLNAPGMKERTLLLVGHADPQGTDAYNDRLGMKRAEEIRKLLVENGIAVERISISTEGAKGAHGDSGDWSSGHDRRVDVVVSGATHSP
jgi:peptidoglycan-associated lipoprotein